MTIEILAAAPAVEVTVAQGSWLGNAGSATAGALILVASWALAKNNMLLWGPRVGDWVDTKLGTKKFDWKSLMSFLLGFAGTTALLGATGQVGSFFRWLQGIFTWFGDFTIVQELGMPFICFICLFQAMKKQDDSVKDIRWGLICALAFPLGGGIWLETSMKMANVLVGAFNGMPSA